MDGEDLEGQGPQQQSTGQEDRNGFLIVEKWSFSM